MEQNKSFKPFNSPQVEPGEDKIKTKNLEGISYETYEEKISEIAEIFKKEKIANVVIHSKENFEPKDAEKGLTFQNDLDTEVALFLLNDLNKKKPEEAYTDNAQTSLIIKGGNEKNLNEEQQKEGLNVFVDVGGSFLKIQKKQKETLVKLDHHGSGQSKNTSATQMMYDVLEKADLLKTKARWIKNIVNIVNSIDNLSYVNRKDREGKKIWNEDYFTNKWPYSVEAIAEQIPLPVLIKLCKDNKIKNAAQIFTHKEINGNIGDTIVREEEKNVEVKNEENGEIELKKETHFIRIKDICEANKQKALKTLEGIEKTIELNKKNGLDTDNTVIGKAVYFNFKSGTIPFKTAFLGAKAKGYESFVAFNNDPKKIEQKFFVNSSSANTQNFAKMLNEKLPGTRDIRGNFIFPPKNLTDLRKFKEADFLNMLIPGQKNNAENEENQEPQTEVKKTRLEILKEELRVLELREQELIKEIEADEKKLAEINKLLGITNSQELNQEINIPETESNTESIAQQQENLSSTPESTEASEEKIGNKEIQEVLNLLDNYEPNPGIDREELEINRDKIISVFTDDNKIEIDRIRAAIGHNYTMYELTLKPGTSLGKITNLSDDLLKELDARFLIPVPGKDTIGVEIPNKEPNRASFKEVLEKRKIKDSSIEPGASIRLGIGINNETFTTDITKKPHLLVAGNPGQGKDEIINTALTSLIIDADPSELKLVLMDISSQQNLTKFGDFSKLNKNYIQSPNKEGGNIISNIDEIMENLNNLCTEMDERYDLLKTTKCKNLQEYNEKIKNGTLQGHKKLHKIVLSINEIAEPIMYAGKKFEFPLARLAQLGRIVGINAIIGTERPSVNILTGIIKANFSNRISTQVDDKIKARIISDGQGAEKLGDKGDILYQTGSATIRLAAGLIKEDELKRVIEFKNRELEKSGKNK